MRSNLALLALDHLPDAMVLVGADGMIAWWSSGAAAMFGHAAGEAVGQTSDLLVPAEQREHESRCLAETLATGQCQYESLRRRRDGSLLYVDITSKAVRDGAGNLQFVLYSKKDVTQLKVLRDARLVQARFGDLLESMPDGIVMVNPAGRIVLANSQAERLFGYLPGELRGQPVEVLLPQRFRDSHVAHRAGFFRQPRTRTMGAGLQLYGRRKDGSDFPVEISLSPLETEDGLLVSSAIRDITDRRRIERALQDQNVALEKALRARDRFLATMSHELRTPLNSIIGFTGTLLMGLPGPLTADQKKQLRTVKNSASHLLSLINDLLNLARIESGKVDIPHEEVDCAELVEEVVEALRPMADAKLLKFGAAVAPGCRVITSRRALSQVILNLASNAIKFTERGSVRIAVTQSAGGAMDFAVSDTGIGIRPDDQGRLFEAFARFETGMQERPEGSGLGLHLSQKLAELMGGRITWRAAPGGGSVFTLTLGGA